MKKYYGGVNINNWIDRVMTAKSDELQSIKKQFKELVERQEYTEKLEADKSSRKIRGEKQVHPQVVVARDWDG